MSDENMVTVTLTRDEYERLLLVLGFAAGRASKGSVLGLRGVFEVINAVGRACPSFIPYELPEPGR